MAHIIDVTNRFGAPINKGGFYLTQPRKPWLVNGIIREETTVFLSAKEGTGKSFVALELASCVAEGRDFFGHEVGQGDVLYVALERGGDQRERLEALRDGKGVNPDCINFLDEQLSFNVPEDETYFVEKVKSSGIKPKIIIIDTLRAAFSGDENSSSVAQETMNAFSRIKKEFGATILILHHVNAFGKSRGSSAFIGAADTELFMQESRSKKTQKVYLTVRKQNNGKKWLQHTLVPQEFDFGNDYSSIVFNLESVEEVDESPRDEEDNPRRGIILMVVDRVGESLSLNKLQQELKAELGVLVNKEELKKDLRKLDEEELLVFDESGNSYKISPLEAAA